VIKKTLAIARRELVSYFSSPLAYVVITAFLLMQGAYFFLIVMSLSQPGQVAMTPLRMFFGNNVFYWFFLLFVAPVITMRLLAEELRSGTIEVLLTSPVTEGQVIAGKFGAAFTFYLVLWLPTLLYVVILKQHSAIDMGPVAAGYLAVLLIGFLFLAIGTFASTLSKNQLIAAIIAFAGLLGLFILPFIQMLLASSAKATDALGYLNLFDAVDRYGQGVPDTRLAVYTLSAGVFFLFLSARSLEARKGR
jgi:ABC-2 type transport system permease protein